MGEFTLDAGWITDEAEGMRDLFSSASHRILPGPITSNSAPAPCRIPTDDICPLCGENLRWLFDFSTIPESFFVAELADAPRRILSCLNCSVFVPVFSYYFPDGTARFHPATPTHKYGRIPVPEPAQKILELAPFPPFATSTPRSLEDPSSFGGAPSFVQFAEHPACPECHRVMFFLAQLNAGEGIYYAFFCNRCRVSAVTSQHS